jgi:hypothetical protein
MSGIVHPPFPSALADDRPQQSQLLKKRRTVPFIVRTNDMMIRRKRKARRLDKAMATSHRYWGA